MKSIHLAAFACALAACGVETTEPVTPASGSEAPQSTEQPLEMHANHDGTRFRQTNLVSDLPIARQQDPNLINAWGLAFGPTGIAWISSNGMGLVNLYDAHGNAVSEPITVPPPPGGTGSAPTGQIFNGDPAAFGGDLFIVATEDGTISGWQKSAGSSFVLRVDNSGKGSVYKGIASASFDGELRLFATDFHNNAIDVFDANYAPISTSGCFTDHHLPPGFAPFNIQELKGALIVTYALQNDERHDDVAGPGNGFVDLYDADGNLLSRLISHDHLNSPWAVAATPLDFGRLADRLLIGNFGDGRIHAFRLENDRGEIRAEPEGALLDEDGRPLAIDGLWALKFGGGTGGFNARSLYFTAGPNHESDGLFGRLDMEGTKHRR
jgi:uncharacterized protein (TIGR03118 family)